MTFFRKKNEKKLLDSKMQKEQIITFVNNKSLPSYAYSGLREI
ncbi:hypothetical protein VITU9109_23529 [Vibrio tubiashii ATCC 19109]|uniref:Transposase n=1 Tax=Vibrio tubiashii ATCC 19109 TaxID=1051646 RepID=A0ABP2LF26_9VIBR|nr:hypothetical protein VITU9109_23529 [Vibrio tubiashii ATCC 19109]